MSAPSLGGVLATRQGSLLLALLCTVVAAAVLLLALTRFKANVSQPIPQATVLVATGEIEKGMTGVQIAREKLYKSTPVAVDQVAAGALSDASAITSSTASTDVLPGQQLTSADFGTISDVAQALKQNQRAVEISTSEAPGATDITQPGSRVDIYAKVNGVEQIIAPDVLVLKPATATPVTIGNKTVPGSTLVLALDDPRVAGVINNASSGSNLYLALRPSKNGPSTPLAVAQAAPDATTTTTTTNGAQ
jgi:Flp pilus assembly protein CpaB